MHIGDGIEARSVNLEYVGRFGVEVSKHGHGTVGSHICRHAQLCVMQYPFGPADTGECSPSEHRLNKQCHTGMLMCKTLGNFILEKKRQTLDGVSFR